ncbi:MAG: HEPN domain-containing protein [Planctomycetota bacterium]
MKAMTREWVDKAEADYAAALLLRSSRKKHSRDIVCFHLQQRVEKYLKARLDEENISFPKTHDLERLLDLAGAVQPEWASLRPSMEALTDYAVEARYPGRSASSADARTFLRAAARIRGLIRRQLGLP